MSTYENRIEQPPPKKKTEKTKLVRKPISD